MKKILCALLSVLMMLSMMTFIGAGEKISFKDVKETRWSYGDIMYAVENGYMNGVGENKFDPAGKVTRGMVVTVLYRLAGSPENANIRMPFKDVKSGKWYYDAVLWASDKGIVNGLDNKTFGPENNITREQLAAIICRYAEFDYIITSDKADVSGYDDYKKVSSYARDNMAWCAKTGLVTGVTDKTLEPKGSATREQFAAILYRYDHAGYKFPDTQVFSYQTVYNSPVPKSTFTEKEYPLVTDADIYVSAKGDDSAPGSFEKPVKTFARAAELVRELKKTKDTDIKVAFMAGEYGNLDALTLKSEDGGDESRRIRYVKYGDGDVVFNNGATFAAEDFAPLGAEDRDLFTEKALPNIKKVSLDGIFDSGLPQGATLYEGKEALIQARIPNRMQKRDMYFAGEMLNVNDDIFYPGVRFIQPANMKLGKLNAEHFAGGTFAGYIVRGYRVDSFLITGYDPNTCILSFDPKSCDSELGQREYDSMGVRTPGIGMDEVYISNVSDLLDTEGEYWCDSKTNTLYVYNPSDEINICVKGNFLTLDDADYISFEGLTFRNSFGEDCIVIKDSEHITIDGCTVKYVAGQGSIIDLSGKSDFLTVKDSDFSSFINHALTLMPERHIATLESNGIVIDNNYFHDCGRGNTFAAQAIVDCCIGMRISHNVFENSESGAVLLGSVDNRQDKQSIRCIIEYNIFTNMLYNTQDYGIIYTWGNVAGRENALRWNLFYNNPSTGSCYSFYIDDTSEGQYVYGNIFYESSTVALMLHNVRDEYIYDNILINSDLSTNGMSGLDDDGTIPEEGLDYVYNSWARDYYFRCRVNEGEPGYELWKEQFPDLYAYVDDTNGDFTDKTNLLCPWNSIHDNAFIGPHAHCNIYDFEMQVGDIHDNNFYTESENPFFKDPTHGDYTVREDADFFKVPFEKMGRY